MAQLGGGSGLVVRPVFKTAMETPSAAPVGSIPTRSRHRHRALVALALLTAPAVLEAQAAAPAAVAPDTSNLMSRPIKPFPAFLMSLAVPGWAQARLDRKLTGAIFMSLEGLSLGMSVKTIRELTYLTRVGADSARLEGKRSQRQDWLILLGFNHLFAGLEAFVATQLHSFPADINFQVAPLPGGGLAAGATIPFRIR